jgi:hypothetical protein
MELTSRQRGFLQWLDLSPQREAQVSRSWADTATELEGLGLIEVIGNHGGLLASLSLAGIGYLQEQGGRHGRDTFKARGIDTKLIQGNAGRAHG